MDHGATAQISLRSQVAVNEALHFVASKLGCDNWYVACHHEHVFVFRLTRDSVDRFAVRVECSEPVEKGVYHESKARVFAVTSLTDQAGLAPEQIDELQHGLARLNLSPV